MSSDDIVQGFTRETSIHGLLRICSPERRWCARGIWVFLFLLANAAFIYQAQLLFVRYFSYPSNVQTSLEFKMLPFPSVTICNQNPIRLSKIDTESAINLYQLAYLNLLSKSALDSAEWDAICSTNQLLCIGISYQSCSASGDCAFEEYQPKDSCFSFDEDYGSSSSCDNSTNDEYSDSTTENPSTASRKKRGVQDFQNAAQPQVSLSMLQTNSKVNSDMIFLLFNALTSDNQTLIDQYKDAFVTIDDFIEDCSYGTQKCDLDANFTAVTNSVYGQCFTFNHINNTDMTDMTANRAGPSFGLRLRLNIHQDEYLYSTDTAGIRVAVHNKGEQPFPETIGYSAEVSTRTSIGITMIETERLPSPWGNCTDNNDIKTHVPYFYSGNYTSQGCVFSCLALKMAELCGCLHHNYPMPYGTITVRFDNTSTTTESSQLPYCNMTMKICADTAENDLLSSGLINSETCGCYPPCYEVNYQSAISISSFPSDKYLETINCARGNDSNDVCYNDAIFNTLQLEVFYEQLNFHRFREEEAYSAVQLVSDLGGQLGLWIGASLLSIAEFISFCISISGYWARVTKRDVEMKRAKITSSSMETIYEKPTKDNDTIAIGPPKPT